ncbi:hypothetical protein A0H81_00985 [Grifola frondosa]|uniref:Uncharacterized protein n=1 Tax=Grifola frondosa TaxID=5627 RepID=A0A1C7MPW4_GRIFR|nr:hypothetical protein A0H81_00985 [Grifola frondosa]
MTTLFGALWQSNNSDPCLLQDSAMHPNHVPGENSATNSSNSAAALSQYLAMQSQLSATAYQNQFAAVGQTQQAIPIPNHNPIFQQQSFPAQGTSMMHNFQQPQPNPVFSPAMFSVQMLNDVIRMSLVAVGSLPDDEERLLHALRKSKADGWKDYFLDHLPRLYEAVESSAGRVKETRPPAVRCGSSSTSPGAIHLVPNVPRHHKGEDHKAQPQSVPSNSASRHHRPHHSAVSVQIPMSSKHGRKTTKEEMPRPVEKKSQKNTKKGHRSTLNSLPDFVSLYPNYAEVRIPTPPLREPTPPTRIEQSARGCRFTDGDKTFLIQWIQWRLKADPTLTKAELCEEMASKVPHHSSSSWASYWTRHDTLPDKILANANNGESLEGNFSETSEEASNLDDHDDSVASADDVSCFRTQSEDSSGDESTWSDAGEDDTESETAVAAGPVMRLKVSDNDLHKIAQYVCSVKNWENLRRLEKWTPFSALHPERSWQAWAKVHQNHLEAIDRLVHKYRRRSEKDREHASDDPTLPAAFKRKAVHISATTGNDVDSHNSKRRKASLDV